MLRLEAAGAESLWDELLPEEVKVAARGLGGAGPAALGPCVAGTDRSALEREAQAAGRSAASHGRPTIPMQTFVRLMVLKHRYGWGYRTLVAGGFGLAAPTPLLPAWPLRAGARRVDGAQSCAGAWGPMCSQSRPGC